MAQDEVLSQGRERGEVHDWAGKGGDGELVGPRGKGAGIVGGEVGEGDGARAGASKLGLPPPRGGLGSVSGGGRVAWESGGHEGHLVCGWGWG